MTSSTSNCGSNPVTDYFKKSLRGSRLGVFPLISVSAVTT